MAQNETSPFAPIFLYFLAKAYDARSGASLKDKGEMKNDKEARSALKLTKNYTIINVKYLCVNFQVSVLSV